MQTPSFCWGFFYRSLLSVPLLKDTSSPWAEEQLGCLSIMHSPIYDLIAVLDPDTTNAPGIESAVIIFSPQVHREQDNVDQFHVYCARHHMMPMECHSHSDISVHIVDPDPKT